MIRGIIFDCFGVLYSGSLETLMQACPADRIDELRDVNKQADYGFITGNEYVDRVAEIIGHSRDETAKIMRSQHTRNQVLIDYAESLRPKYAVGLLSNVSSHTLDGLFPLKQRNDLFDHVLLSYEEHIAKPNPEIFRMMAARMGLRPDECVMIDDLAENCEGAEIAGMQSIQHITNDLTITALQKLL